MKKQIVAFVSGVFVSGMLMLPFTAHLQAASIGNSVVAQTPSGNAQSVPKEQHWHLQKALALLNQAYNILTVASGAKHDFGGHRVAAMQEVKQAISDLQQALQSDQQAPRH